jgi:selenocysteine-specific elongation factor
VGRIVAYLIGTAGHVDHGKTSLIAAMTGIDADRLPEEKARGLTIDLGFAYIDLPGLGRVGIVDVPGHERFIKNMLAGASGVDVALLCIAADEGVKPQTIEHLQVLTLLEARCMVVALTKTDIASSERRKEAAAEVAELLVQTRFQGAQVVPVSAKTGEGMEAIVEALRSAIGSLGPRADAGVGWFMPIDRVFTVAGHGTVITGTLARGEVSSGAEALVMPGGSKVRIRGIQTYGQKAERAEAGQRTALNISGARRESLKRGQAIGSADALHETRCLNVRLTTVAEIKHGDRIRAHIGAGEFIGKLFLFDNAPGVAQLRLESPVACSLGQSLVLRNYSPPTLIAGGEITTPNATLRRKGDPAAGSLANPSRGGSLEERLFDEIASHPLGADTAAICEAVGQSPQALGDAFERLKAEGKAYSFAGRWLAREAYSPVAESVRAALERIHGRNPSSSAIPRADALSASGLGWSAKAFERLIAKMADDGLLVANPNGLRHPEFVFSLTPRQVELLDKVVAEMRRHGAIAAEPAQLAAAVGAPPQAIAEILRLGREAGRVVVLDGVFHYAKETLDELACTVRKLAPSFTVSQFRDLTGSTRKFALPLLQYLDEAKVTRRVGEVRIVLESEPAKPVS